MAKPKTNSVEFLGCTLCTHAREDAALAYWREHGHKAPGDKLPYINMATAECQAWHVPVVSIVNQGGSVHAIPICDRHTHEHGGLLICSACAKCEPHPLGYKREKKSKRKNKHNPAQTSFLELSAA